MSELEKTGTKPTEDSQIDPKVDTKPSPEKVDTPIQSTEAPSSTPVQIGETPTVEVVKEVQPAIVETKAVPETPLELKKDEQKAENIKEEKKEEVKETATPAQVQEISEIKPKIQPEIQPKIAAAPSPAVATAPVIEEAKEVKTEESKEAKTKEAKEVKTEEAKVVEPVGGNDTAKAVIIEQVSSSIEPNKEGLKPIDINTVSSQNNGTSIENSIAVSYPPTNSNGLNSLPSTQLEPKASLAQNSTPISQPPRSDSSSNLKLFVGGLYYQTEDEVRDFFMKYGEVVE